jgi:Flp pilus assembly protein TadB
VIGQAMLLGAGFGLGAALFWYGLRPPRPALAMLLERLRHPPAPAPTGQQRRYRLLGAPLARLGGPTRRTQQDLALLDRDVDTFLAEQAVAAGAGALALPILAGLVGAGGLIPLWAGLAGGLAGYRWALARVQGSAGRRRAELAHTLAVIQDLTAVGMAGGAGIEQALDQATGICHGWAAQRLRHTLQVARLTREPVWQALRRLGNDTGAGELIDLANAIQLAGSEGTRVRTTLATHSGVARAKATAAMEAAARSAGVRMSLPVLVLALGYGLWLLYPALAAMRSGLGV